MIDPVLSEIFVKTFTAGVVVSVIALALRFFNRKKVGARFDQVAAIGFLIGAAFGAFFAIFQAMMVRQ